MWWVGKGPTSAQLPTLSLSPAHLVRDVIILIQEHLELANTDAQVPVCELIGDVEAQGPKLSAFQCIPMEQAQRQQQGLELRHLGEVRDRRHEGQGRGTGGARHYQVYLTLRQELRKSSLRLL